jgi:hypothetical protein
MPFTDQQKAYLLCTIYQSLKDGKYSTTQPEGEFVYIKTPVHGPAIDGSVDYPPTVPNGTANDDGSTTQAADYWFKGYDKGTLTAWEFGYGDPKLPTDPNSEQFKVLQSFVNPEVAPTEGS